MTTTYPSGLAVAANGFQRVLLPVGTLRCCAPKLLVLELSLHTL